MMTEQQARGSWVSRLVFAGVFAALALWGFTTDDAFWGWLMLVVALSWVVQAIIQYRRGRDRA
jgi:uncharacterized membrane protein YdbT with pleckstrin-like domain